LCDIVCKFVKQYSICWNECVCECNHANGILLLPDLKLGIQCVVFLCCDERWAVLGKFTTCWGYILPT